MTRPNSRKKRRTRERKRIVMLQIIRTWPRIEAQGVGQKMLGIYSDDGSSVTHR